MITKFIKINKRDPEIKKVRIAARIIKKGGIVVFPTETVYGIGADAFNVEACKKIYKIKGRPSDNPLMIHVSDMKMASRVGIFPKKYYKIIESLWPGPIAYVVDAKKGLNRIEVAIRVPDNKVALKLIKESNTPIAAPSANLSKKPSSTNAKHALKYFDGKVDIIIDSGATEKGIESTILDLRTFKILRPGAFSVEKITKAFRRRPIITNVARGVKDAVKAISPGMKYKHYAPDTPLFLFVGNPILLYYILNEPSRKFAFLGSTESCKNIQNPNVTKIDLGSKTNLDEVARRLFNALINLDSKNVRFAIIESFPERDVGLGVMNRIRKASNHRVFRNKGQLDKLILSAHIYRGSNL